MNGKKEGRIVKLAQGVAAGKAIAARLNRATSAAPDGGSKPSKGAGSVAVRAGDIARAFKPVTGAIVKNFAESSPQGGGSKDKVMARVGDGHAQGVRADRRKVGRIRTGATGDAVSSPGAWRGPLPHSVVSKANTAYFTLVGRNANQVVVQKVPKFYRPPTAAEVAAIRGPIPNESHPVPLTASHTISTVKNAEYEHIDPKRGRVVRALGSMFLGTVTQNVGDDGSSIPTTVGQRMSMILLNPTALGGRLGLLGGAFEQHMMRHARVVYKPSVAATSEGSLLMYARNDVTTLGLLTGVDELAHASTHASFRQFSVFESAEMNIDPSDINLRYNNSEGSPVDSIQSVLFVEAASNLSTLTGAPEETPLDTPAVNTYGNLYLVYDFEFFSESLDYDVGEIHDGTLTLHFGSAASWTSGEPINPAFAGVSTGISWTLDFDLPDANWMLYGTVSEVSGAPASANFGAPAFSVFGMDNSPHTFRSGQSFYIPLSSAGSNNFSDGSIGGALYASLDAGAGTGVYDTGACIYVGPVPPDPRGYVRFHVRAYSTND